MNWGPWTTKQRTLTYFLRESIIVRLTSCLTGFDSAALHMFNQQQMYLFGQIEISTYLERRNSVPNGMIYHRDTLIEVHVSNYDCELQFKLEADKRLKIWAHDLLVFAWEIFDLEKLNWFDLLLEHRSAPRTLPSKGEGSFSPKNATDFTVVTKWR